MLAQVSKQQQLVYYLEEKDVEEVEECLSRMSLWLMETQKLVEQEAEELSKQLETMSTM